MDLRPSTMLRKRRASLSLSQLFWIISLAWCIVLAGALLFLISLH
jgi:hypothetical protein